MLQGTNAVGSRMVLAGAAEMEQGQRGAERRLVPAPSRDPNPLPGGRSLLMYLLSTLDRFAKAGPEHNSSGGK